MDSPRERDQTIDRLLRQTLETPARGGVTDACLDAETLAAWTAGSLSGAALESAHLHVADCPRCQELAGTLARLGSAVPQPVPAAAPRRWLAWFVPLTAAAAAIAIWFAVPGNLGKRLTNDELKRVEQAAQPPAAEPPAAASVPNRNAPGTTAQPQDVTPRPNERAAPAAADRQLSEAPAAPEAAEPREERARNDTAAPQPARGEGGASASKEAVTSEVARDKAEGARVQAAPSAAAAPAAPPSARFSAAQAPARASITPDIVSPDPAVRWRILGSAVQHSSNGGSTWEAVSTGFPVELTAGAAPAVTVCWLVGRNGVVLLTVDGRTWRRVPFPDTTDLSGVRAVDAGGRVAAISTADGRTLVTTDAGATWVAR